MTITPEERKGLDNQIGFSKDYLNAIGGHIKAFELPKGQFATMAILTRTIRAYYAVISLGEKGYGEDACVSARTIYELALNARWIYSDPTGDRLERYNNYRHIYLERTLDNGIYPTHELEEEVIKATREGAKAWRKKYGKTGPSWSGLTIRELAKKTGTEVTHRTTYAILCDLAHSNPHAIRGQLQKNENGIIGNVPLSLKLIGYALMIAYDCSSSIFQVTGKALRLKLDDTFREYQERYVAIFGRAFNEKNRGHT